MSGIPSLYFCVVLCGTFKPSKKYPRLFPIKITDFHICLKVSADSSLLMGRRVIILISLGEKLIQEHCLMKNCTRESINGQFLEMCLQLQVYKYAHNQEIAILIEKTAPGEGNSYPLQYSGLENSKSMGLQRVRHNWVTFTSLEKIAPKAKGGNSGNLKGITGR